MRTPDAITLVQPLPAAADMYKSDHMWVIADGSNRSGKTMAAAIEVAYAILGKHPIKGKYPKTGGNALFVGRDGDHLAKPMAAKLLEPGQFKVIPDEQTGRLRSVRPHPKFPKRLDDYDLAYKEKWQDAPPLIPDCKIANISWNDRGKGIPRVMRLKNGWQILWRSSKGDPPQGDEYNLVWMDEHIVNEMFYV
jgi:hypothetical protein